MTAPEAITEEDFEEYDMLPVDPGTAEDGEGEAEPNG